MQNIEFLLIYYLDNGEQRTYSNNNLSARPSVNQAGKRDKIIKLPSGLEKRLLDFLGFT